MLKFLKTIRLGLLAVAALLPALPAGAAATLEVSPIRVSLSQDRAVAAVHIHNQGAEQAVVQMSVQSWNQVNGEDQFSDASDIISCPPLVTLAPGQEQVVRVGLIEKNRDWSVEGTYRLFVQEVPPPPTADGRQVQLTVRISLPVFLEPTAPAQPGFDWQIENRGTGGLWLTAANKGNLHALVSGVRLHDGKTLVYEAAQHKYILPGAAMSWRIDAVIPFEGTLPGALTMTAVTDQGAYQEDLPVTK